VSAVAGLEIRERAGAPGKCQVTINGTLCPESAEATWETGCIHEHITTGIRLCAGHRKLTERPFKCLPCEPDHACLVQLRETAS
jgi:hypothetical protein